MTRSHDELIQQAMAASAADDSQKACALLDEAAIADPTSPLPHFLKAGERAQTGDFMQAEADFANALLIAPGFDLARYQLGLLQFSSGKAALALVTWQALTELGDDHALKHFVLGFEALARDEFDHAVASYRRGLACQDVVPAMAGDIQKVIDGIAQLRTGQAKPPEEEPAPAEASHVLLANYGPH